MMAALWFLAGVSKNAEESADAESSNGEVEVIIDGQVSTNDESANAAESSAKSSCNVVEDIVDGDVTTKESAAKDATELPSLLKLLMNIISPGSRCAKKHGGTILRFEEGEEKKQNDKLAGIDQVQANADSQSMQSECQEQEGCKQLQQAPKETNANANMKGHVEDVEFSKLVKELKIESFKSLANVIPGASHAGAIPEAFRALCDSSK